MSIIKNPVSIVIQKGGGEGGWQPDADMQWAKNVCENDVQQGFTYKVLQMISDGYVYTDIVVPSGGAVKTSDGSYYTANAKHTWNDTNARQSAVGDYKVRWLIYYYATEKPSITLLNYVIYACFDGVKFGRIFQAKSILQYFDIINGANLDNTLTDIHSLFYDCNSLITFPVIDTSNVTLIYNMCKNCRCLIIFPLINTSKVTSMSETWSNCYTLKTMPLIDMSNVNNLESAFVYCYSLNSLPLFNTSKVTNMRYMLNGSSLQSLPLFDTSNVARLDTMMGSSSLLQSATLDLNSITSASYQGYLFNGCSNLEFLTLTNIKWDLSISASTKYSHDTLLGIINNLVDLTDQTAQTLTMGSTNLNKLSDEEKAIATNKNWVLK